MLLWIRAQNWLRRPLLGSGQRGAAFTEYAMLIALVAVVVVVALNTFSGSLSGLFERLAGDLDSVGN